MECKLAKLVMLWLRVRMARQLDFTKLNNADLEYIEVATVDEIPEGGRLLVDVDKYPIMILNLAGKLYAVEDTCSHDGNPLGGGPIEGKHIVCPRHGAKFDIENGKAISFPATENISVFPVRIIEGKVEIGLPK